MPEHVGLPPPAQHTVTVATYNIHHGVGADGVLDLERVAGVLEDSGAEVIGVQEVDRHWGDRSDGVDQAVWLADRLGLEYCFAATLDRRPERGRVERRQYGIAILSAYPLRHCTTRPLPNHPIGEQRGLVWADVTVGGVDVRFSTTHLTHSSQPGRLAQTDTVIRVVGQHQGVSVLVGDLNAAPDSAEHLL